MGRLVRQTVRQHGSQYISSVLSSEMLNLHPYVGYRDNLVERLGRSSGCAIILHSWLIGNTERHLRLCDVPPSF